MKKLLTILCSCLLLSAILTGCSNTTSYPSKDANPASDFEYQITDDQAGIQIKKYVGSDQTVVIPQKIDGLPVTVIGSSAFIECDITSLAMPDSVTNIYTYAMAGCQSLTEVRLSQNLQAVGECAFSGCTSLTQMDLSMDSLTHIYDGAFEGCTSLRQVTFGDNVVFIGAEAFQECTSLQEAILPKNLKEVGDYAFALCADMQKIHIPKSLEIWGMYAFAGNTSVTEIVFEEGLKAIGDREHYGCFSNGLVESVTIPASVSYIADNAFVNFQEMTEIIFTGNAPEISAAALIDHTLGNPEQITVYYDPITEGWDTTPIKDIYRIVPYEDGNVK